MTNAAGSHNSAKNARAPLEALNDLAMWRQVIDELMSQYVKEATTQGWSWTHIGRALGMTKQSAHQRFRKPSAPSS